MNEIELQNQKVFAAQLRRCVQAAKDGVEPEHLAERFPEAVYACLVWSKGGKFVGVRG